MRTVAPGLGTPPVQLGGPNPSPNLTSSPADAQTVAVTRRTTILIHAAAPAKPPLGAACNGCGLCCAHEPCPLGMLLSRRRRGPCRALTWDEGQSRYLCGVLVDPPRWLPWLPRAWGRHLAHRWIAAAIGCDAELLAEPA